MPKSKLVGLLYEASMDLERVLNGLESDDAIEQVNRGSSYAWTYAHVTHYVDWWINVRFRQLAAHSYIAQEHFRYGGTGLANDWGIVKTSAKEVWNQVWDYLNPMTDKELDAITISARIPGNPEKKEISLSYYIIRACTHCYYHIGEIATKRDMGGYQVGDYPGPLESCL